MGLLTFEEDDQEAVAADACLVNQLFESCQLISSCTLGCCCQPHIPSPPLPRFTWVQASANARQQSRRAPSSWQGLLIINNNPCGISNTAISLGERETKVAHARCCPEAQRHVLINNPCGISNTAMFFRRRESTKVAHARCCPEAQRHVLIGFGLVVSLSRQ